MRIVISFPKANESLQRKVERAEIEDLLDRNTGSSETWKLKHMRRYLQTNSFQSACFPIFPVLETNKLRPIKDTWQEYAWQSYIIIILQDHL